MHGRYYIVQDQNDTEWRMYFRFIWNLSDNCNEYSEWNNAEEQYCYLHQGTPSPYVTLRDCGVNIPEGITQLKLYCLCCLGTPFSYFYQKNVTPNDLLDTKIIESCHCNYVIYNDLLDTKIIKSCSCNYVIYAVAPTEALLVQLAQELDKVPQKLDNFIKQYRSGTCFSANPLEIIPTPPAGAMAPIPQGFFL